MKNRIVGDVNCNFIIALYRGKGCVDVEVN